MRVAYADPPYVGQAKRHYGDQPDYAGEVDHAALVARLVAEYPDGWALSLSSPSLRQILEVCPPDVRVGAWVKPFCSFKPNVNPAYAWEPVIFSGGRKRERMEDKVRDYCAVNVTLRAGFPGAKPEGFCFWLFALLNLRPGDTLDDLYPGSGAVTRAWARWQRMLPMVRSEATQSALPLGAA
jgi:hypothetical protein